MRSCRRARGASEKDKAQYNPVLQFGVGMTEAYRVEFTERAVTHLKWFPKAARNMILDDIKAQLPY